MKSIDIIKRQFLELCGLFLLLSVMAILPYTSNAQTMPNNTDLTMDEAQDEIMDIEAVMDSDKPRGKKIDKQQSKIMDKLETINGNAYGLIKRLDKDNKGKVTGNNIVTVDEINGDDDLATNVNALTKKTIDGAGLSDLVINESNGSNNLVPAKIISPKNGVDNNVVTISNNNLYGIEVNDDVAEAFNVVPDNGVREQNKVLITVPAINQILDDAIMLPPIIEAENASIDDASIVLDNDVVNANLTLDNGDLVDLPTGTDVRTFDDANDAPAQLGITNDTSKEIIQPTTINTPAGSIGIPNVNKKQSQQTLEVVDKDRLTAEDTKSICNQMNNKRMAGALNINTALCSEI
jgi:hypothetical protein